MPYQQIDKEHYPQLYKNKRQRVVLSAIGTGREQGAHLRDLHRATGFGERSVRKVIEDIRRAGVVVCNSLLLWCSLISSHHLCHEAAHGLCGFVLLLTGGVGVGAESEPRIVVPQHTADSFHVHAVL